jgi:hypothetical protein
MKTTLLACVTVALLVGCTGVRSSLQAGISFVWACRAGAYVRAAPTGSDGVVYVGVDDNALHAADASTGERLWDFGTTESPSISLWEVPQRS